MGKVKAADTEIANAMVNPNEFSSEHIAQALLMAAEKLPPKRITFVDHYVSNGFNGVAAYRSAKYKGKTDTTASTEAFKILGNARVSTYLMWKLRQVMARDDSQIDEGRLIRESNALAYASITDVLDWDEEGKITVKPSKEIPREVAGAIKKFKSTTRTMVSEDGPDIETTTVEIEMHDKKGALDLQARIAGMMHDKKVEDHSHYTLIMNIGPPPPKKVKSVITG